MVGGTIADIWNTHERGLPMSMFALAAIFGTGAGPVVAGMLALYAVHWISRADMSLAGWVEQTIRWRWIEWIAMCLSGALTVWLIVYGAQETRGTIMSFWLVSRRQRANPGSSY